MKFKAEIKRSDFTFTKGMFDNVFIFIYFCLLFFIKKIKKMFYSLFFLNYLKTKIYLSSPFGSGGGCSGGGGGGGGGDRGGGGCGGGGGEGGGGGWKNLNEKIL